MGIIGQWMPLAVTRICPADGLFVQGGRYCGSTIAYARLHEQIGYCRLNLGQTKAVLHSTMARLIFAPVALLQIAVTLP